jgi:hypothetical protein
MASRKMSRKQAAALIERIRIIVAENPDRLLAPALLQDVLSLGGLAPLERCTGEAHGNPHIDNCGQCAPRWGWLGDAVTIR